MRYPARKLAGVPAPFSIDSGSFPEVRPRVVELLYLAILSLNLRVVHRSTIDSGRRPRLEPLDREPRFLELFREVSRGRLPRPSAGQTGLRPDMDPASQERSGRYHHCAAGEHPPLESDNSGNAVIFEDEPCDSSLNRLKILMLFDEGPDSPAVESPVALSAWRPDCRSLAPVQHAKLEGGHVSRSTHDPAERVHFAHYGSFRNSADRRIAGHLSDRFERARDKADASAQPCSRNRGFGSGMTGTDHDHIEVSFSRGRVGHGAHTLETKGEPCH